ncbi:unnamed protein product [Macrosiphum euphorbiae]|uniref:DDE Tnp4 domain-containing protein n=1 Tax=Macrosiphum euphorbiae TaxID=13131 RepID=A0AAV0WFY8_9HEMI|nr:unnamed protein product [Macrosiphum euphorbiae]
MADQKCINIFCGWPGLSHDARVLREPTTVLTNFNIRLLDVYHKSYCRFIITAVCVLHNICISHDDIEVEEYEQYILPAVSDTGNGIYKRDELCALNYEQ